MDSALTSDGIELDLTHTFKTQDSKFFLPSFKPASVLSEHKENTGGPISWKKKYGSFKSKKYYGTIDNNGVEPISLILTVGGRWVWIIMVWENLETSPERMWSVFFFF